MKTLTIFISALVLSTSPLMAQLTQTLLVRTRTTTGLATNLALEDGTNLSPGNGVGMVGIFVESGTAIANSVIGANWYDFDWMAARFRPFGDTFGGTVFTIASSLGNINASTGDLTDNELNSATGFASSVSLANTVGIYAWVFSGSSVPTNQTQYLARQTGVFFSPFEQFFDGTEFGNIHTFSFRQTTLTGAGDPNTDGLPGTAVDLDGAGPLNNIEYRLVAVPEPSTVALALLGAAGVLIARRRRK